jgi:amidase
MHGFPQAIKDLVPVKGIRTTQGSPIFKDFIATTDAIHVERVKAAGAIIIGKTNVPEFGLGSHTYNPVFGTPMTRPRPPAAAAAVRRCRSLCACFPLPTAPIMAARCAIRAPSTTCSASGPRSDESRRKAGTCSTLLSA